MQNFFIEDEFFSTLDDLIDYIGLDVEELDDNWTTKVKLSELEPMFQFNEKFIVDAIINNTDLFEDRFPENSDNIFDKIKEGIIASVDLDKLNKFIPLFYFPTGHYKTITKQDLLDFKN
jgi:hypothetical protein